MINKRGECSKQVVTATLITSSGYRFIDTNWCNNVQPKCPREGMPSGEGYELCRDVCKQEGHAEVNVINKAMRMLKEKEHLRGATLRVKGHTYVCSACKLFAEAHGITDIGIEEDTMSDRQSGEGNYAGEWYPPKKNTEELIAEVAKRTMKDDTNPKKAHGALKAPMNHCPNTALIELQAVMAGGAHKYGDYNFRDSPIDAMTYIGAIRRHLFLWEDGVDTDMESGRSHLAHIMACCALALDSQHTGQFLDNRSKTGKVKEILESCADSHNKFVTEWERRQRDAKRKK